MLWIDLLLLIMDQHVTKEMDQNGKPRFHFRESLQKIRNHKLRFDLYRAFATVGASFFFDQRERLVGPRTVPIDGNAF